MAPARGAQPAERHAGEAHGVPRDHPAGHPRRHGQPPRHRPPPGRRPGGPPPPRPHLRLRPARQVARQKVGPGTTVGRVQSVATRLVVERERERMAFVPAGYWDLEGTFAGLGARTPSARRVRRHAGAARRRPPGHGQGLRRARRLTRRRGRRSTRRAATALAGRARRRRLRGALRRAPSPTAGGPFAPFITSTLQQEAGRKLRLSASIRPCARPRASTRRATSPTCGPTRPRCRTPRSRRPGREITERYGAQFRARRAPRLRQEGRERPGGPRGHPPGRRPLPLARGGRPRGQRQRRPGLRADLEAHHRLADDRRHRRDRHRPPRVRSCRASWPRRRVRHQRHDHHPPGLPPGIRSTGRWRRRRRAGAPAAGARRGRRRSTPPTIAADGHDTQPPARFTEAALVKRARGARRGPPVHLRLHHQDHPGPRVRVEEGHRARPVAGPRSRS